MQQALDDILDQFPYLTARDRADHTAVNCPVDNFLDCIQQLKDQFDYDFLIDVTAIDWDVETPRFTGIYHLFSTRKHCYLRLAVDCEDSINPSLPSLAHIYPAADWHERETFDLMGIHYKNHPDLRRILMWDDYPYHPLRKEFPLAGIEVPLPAADVAERTGTQVEPAPMMGGPFVSSADGPMSQTEPRARDESWTESKTKPVV